MAMYYDITPLTSSYEATFGGICWLELVPREWMDTPFQVDISNRTAFGPITFFDGKDWLRAACLIDTLQYEEKQVANTAGTSYSAVLTGVMVRDELERLNLTDSMRYHEYIVRYQDRNGLIRMIGNKKYGMRFSSDYLTGAKSNDISLYSFQLSMQLLDRAPAWVPQQ